MEHKRNHHWLVDHEGSEIVSSKKQTYEAGNERSPFGAMDTSLWHETASFQPVSGSLSGRMFESEVSNMLALEGNLTSLGGRNTPIERLSFSSQYSLNSSLGLPMSLTVEEPSGIHGSAGFRKTKAIEGRHSHIDDPAFLDQVYDSSTMATAFNAVNSNTLTTIPSYSETRENTFSNVSTLCKDDGRDFISTSHVLSKGHINLISNSNIIKREDSVMLPISQPLDGREVNFASLASSCGPGENCSVSLASTYGKEDDTLNSVCSISGKTNNNFIQGCPSYNQDDENSVPMNSAFDRTDPNVTSLSTRQDSRNPSVLSMGSSFYRNGLTNISFSDYANGSVGNLSGSIFGDYNSFTVKECLNKTPSAVSLTDFDQSKSASASASNYVKAPSPKSDSPKGIDSKGTKKAPANNFPSNVKSLLSTGMLDGNPVKYVSWSREKNLRGTIQGTRYLCGCNECNFSKALNAYEFERHACCKTKHPNNHIYFDNGKTIYAVVQELKNTPQEVLFDAIQNVTGSPINQKNFRIWKASYQAATRELQRIYGKDDVSLLS